MRVVDVSTFQELHHGIIVDKVIKLLGATAEAGHDLALMLALQGVGDIAILHQWQQAIREHLSVHTKVLVMGQTR